MKKKYNLLKTALRVNAVFSFTTGLIALFNTSYVSGLLNVESVGILRFIGINLIIFAIGLSIISLQKRLNPRLISIIIILDWSWVLGSGIILFLNPFNFSSQGLMAISIIGLIVSTLAVLQRIGLKRMNINVI